MNKKNFKSFLFTSVLLVSSIFTVSGISFLNENESSSALKPVLASNSNLSNNNIKEFKIADDKLESDVKSLEFYVNLNKQTINYKITFKTNEFDNTSVNSFYFYALESSAADWSKLSFDDSFATVKNKTAKNEASYKQILSLDYYSLYGYDNRVKVGVDYQKNGKMISATKQIFEIQVHDVVDFININDNNTKILLNDEKTFADIYFNLTYSTTTVKPSKIILKSNTDNDLAQEIFTASDYNLIQGQNVINQRLLTNYNYKDLYLEFHFQNFTGASYFVTSDVLDNSSFISGEIKTWDTTSIILLVVILLFILLTIPFILLILKLMKRRKDLELLNKVDYYEDHYSK